MISKNTIKLIHSLDKKKYRQKYNLFVVEGEKNVKELINSDLQIKEIFATDSFLEKTPQQNKITLISEKELLQISKQQTPNKALALAFIPKTTEIHISPNKLYLMLDNIQDPGNLGTIIRSANWFGVDTIFCSPRTVNVYNNKVVQSAMGALFAINIIYTELDSLFAKAKKINLPIIGTSLSGKNMHTIKLPTNGIVLMGNESKGIQQKYEKLVDLNIKIPHYNPNEKNIESLNVAVATSIVLNEMKRDL